MTQPPPCRACKHCYCEPDDDFVCGHPESGAFGLYVLRGRAKHCKEVDKFEQHPHRTPEGNLK